MSPPRRACYGFGIDSDLPLHYALDGWGDPLVVEVEDAHDGRDLPLIREWSPPVVPFHARLHGRGDTYRLWVRDVGWFAVETAAGTITVPAAVDPVRREERLWGLPILLSMLWRGDLPLHAAAIEVGGHAVVLAAPGRFGKTTLAAAAVQQGYRLLSEDLTCVDTSGVTPCVVPGPAMLRVRRDMADRLDMGDAVAVARDADRVHFSTHDPRYTADPVPLAAILLLRVADGRPRLESVDPATAVRDLWQLSFHLPSGAGRSRCFAQLGELVSAVPVQSLVRELRLRDLEETVVCMASTVAAHA